MTGPQRLPRNLRRRVAHERDAATLTPLLGLQQATTRTDATTRIALYRQAGASDEEAARAWELWEQMQRESVTYIPARTDGGPSLREYLASKGER